MKLDYQNYVLGLLLCLPIFATAQVGINNTNPQAQLDITASNVATPSNTDGLLIPRVNTFPVTNPTASQQGMLIYLTTTVGLNLPGFYYWDNSTTAWKTISPTPTEVDPQVSSTANNRVPKWNLTSLVDSQIYDNGTNVGVGTTSPGQKLDVNGNIRGTNIYATSFLQSGALLPNTVTPIATFQTSGTMPVLIGDSSINKGILIGRLGNDIQGRSVANFTTNSDLLLNSQGGNVGIGTTAPTQKLHVSGGDILADRAALSSSLTRKLTLEGARAVPGNPFSEIDFNNYDSTTSISYTGASIQSNNNDGTEDGDLRFFTNNGTLTEKMIINPAGLVGIGTSTPTEKLEVVGKTKTTNLQITNGATAGYVLQSDATGNGTWVNSSALSITETDPQVSSATSNFVSKWNGTTLVDGQIFDNGTSVGIGTTATTGKLNVAVSTGEFMVPNWGVSGSETVLGVYSSNTTDGAQIRFDSSTSDNTDIGRDNVGNFVVQQNDTERLVVTPLGNVGIGSGTPTEKLEIVGKTKTTTIQITNGATAGYVLQSDATGNGTWVNSSVLSVAETDPQVSSSTFNYIPKWNGTTLVDGQIFDNGTSVGIGTTATTGKLNVAVLSGEFMVPNWGVSGGETILGVYSSNTADGAQIRFDSSTSDDTDIGRNNVGNFVVEQNDTERLVVTPLGNVGIGTSTPTEKLEIVGKTKTTNIQITNGATAGYVLQSDVAGNGTWLPESDPQVSSTSSNYVPKWDGTTLVDGQVFDNGTNVGIGTTSPIHKLDVNGNIRGTNMYATSFLRTGLLLPNTVTPIATFNTEGSMPVLIGDATLNKGILIGKNGNDIQGRAVANFTTNSDLLLNSLGGNVGIGTTTPTQAKLVVNGFQNFTTAYGYLNSTGTTGTSGSASNAYSIYASSRIAATEFNAFSDARIKKVLRRSNSKEDLAILSKIQITDYKHIDTIANSNKTIKKVIAQEIKEVFPNAVSIHSEFIPNIYKLSEIKNGSISVVNDFKKGDKVKLIFTDGEKIVEVKNATSVNFEIDSEKLGKVFVYGKQVNDFHTVDYEALSTLNISATQELLKRIENLENLNKKLEEQINEVKALKLENLQLKAENNSIHEMQKDIELLKKTLLNDASENNIVKK